MRQIDGMAALALWDAAAGRLHLARDRYGTKPLYLWRGTCGIAFASEMKAFLALPDFRRGSIRRRSANISPSRMCFGRSHADGRRRASAPRPRS